MEDDKFQEDAVKKTQENAENDLPEWLREYSRRYREIIQELITTSESRNKQHEEALEALKKAVMIANRASLDFLEDTNILIQKKDLSDKK